MLYFASSSRWRGDMSCHVSTRAGKTDGADAVLLQPKAGRHRERQKKDIYVCVRIVVIYACAVVGALSHIECNGIHMLSAYLPQLLTYKPRF